MKITLIIFTICSLYACSFNNKVPQTGLTYLQGSWIEDSVKNQSQLVNYENYKFRFTCDSFYLNIESFSKVNLDGGECYNQNNWQEYVKGTYTSNKDTLHLNGAFVTENFKYKPEGSCYRFGKFEEDFLMKQVNEDTLEIRSTLSAIVHQLILTQKTTCNPEIAN